METNCDCILCKNSHEFAISKELMGELLNGKVTIFAGAGISTEARSVLKENFYESITAEIQHAEPSPSFPALMEEYCRQPNGRFKLLKKIKDRFDHIDSFPELNRSATRFHRELGTFFPIRNIITTNWDTYFEQFCNATPFVSDPDLTFWEVANRRVLKIHGSITNFGSIVATTTDYKKCQKHLNSDIIGGLLKTILATQTVIFIGYSFSDSDFTSIYTFVKKQMNSLHKQAYVVTPFADDCEKFKAAGLLPIRTDGAFFINRVKAHAVAQGVMLDDEVYGAASELFHAVLAEHALLHKVIKATEYPEIIFAASYQDGMMHALERALNMRGTGEYSHRCRVQGVAQAYIKIAGEKRKKGLYEDVAYIEGYINALTYLLMNKDERKTIQVPIYFMFGSQPYFDNRVDFLAELKRTPNAHKAAHKRARSYLKSLSNPESAEFHHPPWL